MTIKNRMRDRILIAFISCLGLMLLISFCHASDTTDALSNYKELQSKFIQDQKKLSKYQPEHPPPIHFPLSRLSSCFFGSMTTSQPANEEVHMNGNHSKKQVQDIDAINSVKRRTIVYDDVHKVDGECKGNSIDIHVTGSGQGNQDNALESTMDYNDGKKPGSAYMLGNNLNIDVSGISVSAINTIHDGSAIATSNIVIKPVQVIVESSEAGEKLK
jgi:hypothetical protein